MKIRLISILVTIAICLVFAWVSYLNAEEAKVERAYKQMGLIGDQIERYNQDTRTLPKSLEDISVDATDPWGKPFIYKAPGDANPHGFDLISYGKDGKIGGKHTNADIYGGIDGIEMVKVRNVRVDYCSRCKKSVYKDEPGKYLPYREAEKFPQKNGRFINQSTYYDMCANCKQELEMKVYIHYMLDKNQQQLLKILGNPSSDSYQDLTLITKHTILTWHYKLAFDYRFFGEIHFKNGSKYPHNLYFRYKTPGAYQPSSTHQVRKVIPSSILEQKPLEISYAPGSGFRVMWKIKKGYYVADLYRIEPIESTSVDAEGRVKIKYEIPSYWKDTAQIISIAQGFERDNFSRGVSW